MLEELRPPGSIERFLREEEKVLLLYLFSHQKDFELTEKFLDGVKVYDMSDGGMGSIKFLSGGEGELGGAMVEAEFFDVDGVLVSVAVNSNSLGDLYEMDFWKSDFSSLVKYPRPEIVKII